MKRIGTMLMASLLLLGLAQCKKEKTEEPDTDEGVYITVNVNGDSKGSRAIVNPNAPEGYATVDFEEGDKLYVSTKGVYRGYLTYDGSKFSGKIGNPWSGDYLHFYFVGNFATDKNLPKASRGGRSYNNFTVDITDQTSKYPVIAYGHSTDMYSTEITSYSATLDIYCAIIKIPIEGAGTANTVTLHNMKNVVSVDVGANYDTAAHAPITANPFTFPETETDYREIKLHAESDTEKWAIVLPQRAVLAQLSCDGFKNAIVPIPEITADRYYDDDVSGVTLTPGTPSDSRFSVAPNTQVCFSPGNLQAVFAEANNQSCTWRFAEHQYDCVGDAVGNTVVGFNCVTTPGTVDLFGWVGASCDDYNYIYSNYSGGPITNVVVAYGISNSVHVHMQYGQHEGEPLEKDWGEAAASLGGYNTWRTPSIDEWDYLFNTRATNTTINGIANARYTRAIINTDGTPVKGIILFPDDGYSGPTSNAEGNPFGITFDAINGEGMQEYSYWGTQCTISGWNTLEFAGCVFLPAAGCRQIITPSNYTAYNPATWGGTNRVGDVNARGYYWSSTSSPEDWTQAKQLHFDGRRVSIFVPIRNTGSSVRLVRPAD